MGAGQTEEPCTEPGATVNGIVTLNGVMGEGLPGTFRTVTLCPVDVDCLQLPSGFFVLVWVP